MTEKKIGPPTQRTLKTHFRAYVDDPEYPSDQFWSIYGYEPDPEQGQQVTMTGELAVAHQEGVIRLGVPLTGTYETYWSQYDRSGVILAMITSGARTIGALSAGVYDLKSAQAFTVAPAQALDAALGKQSLETTRSYHKVAGGDAVACPLGAGIHHVSIDFLLDERHEPCGFVFNGEDEFVFEERVLPHETDRATTRAIIQLLADAPRDGLIEVRSSNGENLGVLSDFDPGATWNGRLNGDRPVTVAALVDEGAETLYNFINPHNELGMQILHDGLRPGSAWVRNVEVAGGRTVFHLGEEGTPLPDRAL